METMNTRALEANAAWDRGQALEQRGDLLGAYACYRQAHDLVVDCPKMHETAHKHLKRINWMRANYRELATDVFLLGFAAVGIFELVAYLLKGQVLGSRLCARKGVHQGT